MDCFQDEESNIEEEEDWRIGDGSHERTDSLRGTVMCFIMLLRKQ